MNTCECDECRKYVEQREAEERKLWEADSPASPLDDVVVRQQKVDSSIEDRGIFEDFERRLRAAQKDLPPEFAKVLDDHFEDLLA